MFKANPPHHCVFKSDSEVSPVLPALFEATVEKFANKTAVTFKDEVLNYKNLNQQVNKLAHFLIQHQVAPEKLVGIIAERSFEMIISIYGILKAGAGFLPLSPADPVSRIQNILNDATPTILLIQRKFFNTFSATHAHVFSIEEILEEELPICNPPLVSKSNDIAYVIYTSGSTGMPKGVIIEHHSVVNRLQWMQEVYPINSHDVIMQKTPFTFDVSVWELLWWGLQGASVHLPLPNNEKNPMALVSDIKKYQVSVLHFVPSMFNVFLEYIKLLSNLDMLASLRLMFTSGEALQKTHCRKFNNYLRKAHKTRLINLYGPTEATIDVTHYECPNFDNALEIPIGKPIQNTRVYVLGSNGKETTSDTGELCIAGAGLARGYLNRVELTHAKFDYPLKDFKERVYRTGDLANWGGDGNLQYCGRMDHQVKIRGIRIELGEIEAVLNDFQGVETSVIDIKRPSENVILLIAFYVSAEEKTEAELKEYLKKRLPEYMIPNFFRQIKCLPLTPHGKVNRSALPELSLK